MLFSIAKIIIANVKLYQPNGITKLFKKMKLHLFLLEIILKRHQQYTQYKLISNSTAMQSKCTPFLCYVQRFTLQFPRDSCGY